MLLPRLYWCFQTGLSLGDFACLTPKKPNGTSFDKEARGSKCNHTEAELMWEHGASEHIPVLSQDKVPTLLTRTEASWSFLLCISKGIFKGWLQSKSRKKSPFWSSLGLRRWQEQAGSGVTLRCIDRMQKGTNARSELADCTTAAKYCYFLKINATNLFYFFKEDDII